MTCRIAQSSDINSAMRTSIDARANLHVIEEKYHLWQENPDSVDSGWSAFFEGFELGNLPERNGAVEAEVEAREAALQTRVDGLVYAYCSLGHTIARITLPAMTKPIWPLSKSTRRPISPSSISTIFLRTYSVRQ